MFEAIGLFVLGLFLLALGGDSIVKGASGLAQRFGASPFVAGLLLVAFGTSLPELAVNARAFFTGSQALALGNAVGSNIVNFGLTLGAAAVAAPLLVRWRALTPMLVFLILATIALIVAGFNGVLSRVEGIVLLLAFVAALAFLLARSRRESADLQATISLTQQTRSDVWLNLLRFVIAIALLYFGARWVVQSAPILGVAMGMEPLLTGLLVVAIGTALPEMAAAVVAARRGQGDLVVGHVIGSSLFNLLIVLGGMAALRDMPIPASFVKFELPAALAFTLLLFPMLKGDMRISKTEGIVLLAAFVAWIVFELLITR